MMVIPEPTKFDEFKFQRKPTQSKFHSTTSTGPAPQRAKLVDESLIPTADELFGPRPYSPPPPLPPAWEEDSIANYFANEECARLIANCLYDPPITEKEIDRHARRFGLSERRAELEIRRSRSEL